MFYWNVINLIPPSRTNVASHWLTPQATARVLFGWDHVQNKHAFTTTTTTSSDSNHRNVNYDCTTLAPLSTALLFDCSRHRSTSPSAVWNVWNVLELGEMTKAGLCMFEF